MIFRRLLTRLRRWWLRREIAWVEEYRREFPGSCPLCGHARWGRSMGFPSAFQPLPPHRCPEVQPPEEP